MPKSGSYYYPAVQVPNSSYPSVDVRELSSPPSTGDGLGKIYALSADKDLYFKDSEGNEIAIASAGAGSSNVFGDVYVSGTLYTSGSISSTSTTDSMIINSAEGSVAMSGNLWLYGSSDIGRVGTYGSSLGLYVGGQSRLSVDSGGINLVADTKLSSNRSFYAEDHLILSSSGGSIVHVSGAFEVDEEINFPASNNISVKVLDFEVIGGNATFIDLKSGGNLRLRCDNDHVNTSVPLSVATTKTYDLRSTSGHLVLSSSDGSVVHMSGALKHDKRTAATMPPGSISMSGAVVWVDDTKTLAVYGPLGWTRILTGSVI